MTSLALVGVNTFHAKAFTRIFNGSPEEESRIPDARITHVWAGGHLERLAELQEKLGAYDTVVEDLDDIVGKVDGVLVVDDTDGGAMHAELARPFIEAGMPVFIDKPMTTVYADAAELFDLAEAHNAPLMSSSALRFPVELDKEAIAEHGGEGFSDGVVLIRSGTVDIVSLCTPPLFHRELAIAAAEAGVAVLCEKPLARTLEDAEAIVEAVERAGTLFSVEFCHRFEPAIEKLKAMIEDGALGEVIGFRNRFAGLMANAHETWFSNPAISGGGALADTSIHPIDLFRHLVGDVVNVQAMTSTRETEHGTALDVEDTGVMLLRTARGEIGVVESSWRTPPGEWTVTVYGTKGSATVDYGTGSFRFTGANGETNEVPVANGSRFDREFAYFLACWRGKAEPRVTLRDGWEANRVLRMAYASAGG